MYAIVKIRKFYGNGPYAGTETRTEVLGFATSAKTARIMAGLREPAAPSLSCGEVSTPLVVVRKFKPTAWSYGGYTYRGISVPEKMGQTWQPASEYLPTVLTDGRFVD